MIFLHHQFFSLDQRKAQETAEYQWQKDNIKNIAEQGQKEDAERAVKNREKQISYRRDLFGQMDYEQRKKHEVIFLDN